MKKLILFILLMLPLYVEAQTSGESSYLKGIYAFEGKNGYLQDINKAYEYIKTAANQGYAPAMSKFADLCIDRHTNYEEALRWANKAAAQNDAYAYYVLGRMHEWGYVVIKDYDAAKGYYLKAANMGCTDGFCGLGGLYLLGKGVNKDISKSVNYYREAANKNNCKAIFFISSCYFSGLGVEKNADEAVKWLKKGAEFGDLTCINELAHTYRNGLGIAKDYNNAFKWYKISAEKGNEDGFLGLAELLEKGHGVKHDYQLSFDLCQLILSKAKYDTKAKRIVSNLQKKNPAIQQSYEDVMERIRNLKEKPLIAKNEMPSNNVVNKRAKTENLNIERKIDNTFVVIISNEDYQNETNVDYAKNDGMAFKECCNKSLGIPDKNVHYVTNATLNNIIGELDWIQHVCEAYEGGANVIFYYAGHGLPDESSGSSYILPVDGNSRILRTCLSLNELYNNLGKLPAKKVTILLDACFSGAKRDGGMLAAARGVAIKAKPQSPLGSMVVFSAAQGEETAYKYDDAKHGLFTFFLLEKLNSSKGNVTFDELSKYVIDQVKRFSILENGKSQSPSVMTSDNLRTTWKLMKFN